MEPIEIQPSARYSNMKFTLMTRKEQYHLTTYVAAASVLLILVVLFQYLRYGIFGTSLLLGWDSPGYVWIAKEVITKGPIHMIVSWNYPHFYVQLLAFSGYLTNNVVMMERILPIFFAILLIYANSRIVLKITKRIYVAGLASLLTVLSVNVLRLLADLHRNLMAFSLSMITFLIVLDIDNAQSFPKRKYLFFTSLLFVIAGTQFETYFILCLSLVLYGFLTKNLKITLMLTLACAIPALILLLLFPTYFTGYITTIVFFERQLTLTDIFLWTGSSWMVLGFLTVGLTYLFYKAKQKDSKLARLVFCWVSVITLIVALSGFGSVLPAEFAIRSLFILPVPVLLSLSVSACDDFVKSLDLKHFVLSIRSKHSVRVNVQRLLLFFVIFGLIASSGFAVNQRCDEFLTSYVPRSGYEKIMAIIDFFANSGSSQPVVVFYGEPGFWFSQLYRSYIGMEIGEHFAYYGNIEGLFHLTISEPKITYDPYLMEIEKYYAKLYLTELFGNWSGASPPMYVHESHITSPEDLMSHPIIIVTPDFYNDKIPYCLKPFHVGDGTYFIPPYSAINFTEVFYGSEITVIRNGGFPNDIKTEYSYIDPQDSYLVYLKLNASSGYQSYNLTYLPSNMTFAWMEQGNDLSYPENNPMRLDGSKAVVGNDPTESPQYWTTPIAEQGASFQIDASTKKEGNSSLKIIGKTDSWGNLAVRYDTPGTWNLAGYSSIGMWVKCNESAAFSMTLVDRYGGSRTFWAIKAGGSSATASWKRLVANLTEYTSQTPDFRIDSVDHINLFVSSNAGRKLSFWIDDLTVDTTLNLHSFVYKDRVPVDETVVAYFYTRIEDVQ
jgi:hypothetical protein